MSCFPCAPADVYQLLRLPGSRGLLHHEEQLVSSEVLVAKQEWQQEDAKEEDQRGPSRSTTSFMTSVAGPGLAVALALGLHWEGANHRFAYDDHPALLRNGDVMGRTPWEDLLKHDFWGAPMTKPSANKSFRPITVATWRLLNLYTKSSTGEPSPWWFHSLNIWFHGVVTLQVFALARQLASLFGSKRPHLRALIGALIFAVHPVHVEVIIGIVGLAELLCAFFGIPALQLLLCSDDALVRPAAIFRTLAGFALMGVATFCKEIGITICGIVVLWDGMVIPYMRLMKDAGMADAATNRPGNRTRVSWSWLRACIAVRGILAVTLVAAYKYGVRVRIAGGHDLVSNFRRQENPFAYITDRKTLVLSVLFNHASYVLLLLFPRYLSADWSYACTSYIEDWQDARNAGTAALYAFLVLVLLRSRPWRIAGRMLGLTKRIGGDEVAVEQAFLIYGLMVIPFMPATNLFFWVGTAKGERLLYFPSIGFVQLLAQVIISDGWGGSLHRRKISWWRGIVSLAVLLLIIVPCSYRTLLRVPDWQTEERLFEKAYEVCPNSGKVLQNMGIIMQHENRLDDALELFRTAHEIDPSTCDFSFFVSQTLLMQGSIEEGLPGIHDAAVGCKTERQKSLDILSQVLQRGHDTRFEMGPDKIHTHRTVALALLQESETGDPAHGCHLLEQSLWTRMGSTHPLLQEESLKKLEVKLGKWMQRCFEFLAESCERDYSVKKPTATPFARCIKNRVSIAQAMAKHGRGSEEVMKAMYKYLKSAKELGCMLHPSRSRLKELCGVDETKLANMSYRLLAATNFTPAAADEGDNETEASGSGTVVSDEHRTVVHMLQAHDSNNPWLHLAWAEVLLLEQHLKQAIEHISVAGNLLVMGFQEFQAAQGGGLKRLSQKGERTYSMYLHVPVAPAVEMLPQFVQNLTAEVEALQKLQDLQEVSGRALALAPPRRAGRSLRSRGRNMVSALRQAASKKAVGKGRGSSKTKALPPPARAPSSTARAAKRTKKEAALEQKKGRRSAGKSASAKVGSGSRGGSSTSTTSTSTTGTSTTTTRDSLVAKGKAGARSSRRKAGAAKKSRSAAQRQSRKEL